MLTIGISGSRASFSEQAAQEYARENDITQTDIDYLISVERVLAALEEERVEIGVFPVHNSIGGIVREALPAMAAHVFEIKDVVEIDVRHFLMVLEGTKEEEIASIASHPQALAQCRLYLKTKWPEASLAEYGDTAKAAQDLKAGVLPKETAVIAPRAAADLYDLDILGENIQDLQINHTTFIVATKKKE